MRIRKKVLSKVIILISFMCLLFACKKEIEDTFIDSESDILESKLWYENHFSDILDFNSTDLVKGSATGKPDWKNAFSSNHKDSRTVEAPLIVQGEFGFATEDSYKAFKETSDKRFMLSRTTIVIEKKGNKFIGFLMTIIPDKDFLLKNDFKALTSSYKKLQKGFSGSILYHNLNGTFSNGWVLLEGNIIHTIKHQDNSEFPIELISKGCWAYYYVKWGCQEAQSDKGVDALNCKYYETWDYLYTLCDGDGGGGGDPGGVPIYLPPDTPCIGDPITNPTIASPGASGTAGGMYGCVRFGSDPRCDYTNIPHYGMDIACDLNSNLYSMMSGEVLDINNSFLPGMCVDGSYGNWIKVRCTNQDGSFTDIFYAHLNTVNVAVGDQISYGQFIGESGNTGNAGGINITPHVHIEVAQNGTRINPKPFFATDFNSDGSVNVPCSNN